MRSISGSIVNKLNSKIQAGANKLSASLWVGRPTTPLTEDRFLEKQNILISSNITAIDISVCHPSLMRGASYVYVAFIEYGIAKIKRAEYREDMPDHEWEDVIFSEEAQDISICFDGVMPKAMNGSVEFITDQIPWVFWINNGVLYGKKINDENVVILAESNCSKVSAVRAMWSEVGGFDFGLTVFFLLNGKIHYRQFINNEWFDAEVVSIGPNVTYEDVAAFRTWDYRIGIQAKSTNGNFYELFTQFMGIGKQNVEHIEVQTVKGESNLQEIRKLNTVDNEHIEVSNVRQKRPFGGLYSLDIPELRFAENLESENNDWGKLVRIKFNVHINKEQVEEQYPNIKLIDSLNIAYTPSSAVLQEDGKTMLLYFENFNNAMGICRIQYNPGTIESMAGIALGIISVSFTPINLVPLDIPVPEVEDIWNE